MSSAGNCSRGKETWLPLRRHYQTRLNRWQRLIYLTDGDPLQVQPAFLQSSPARTAESGTTTPPGSSAVQCSVYFKYLATLKPHKYGLLGRAIRTKPVLRPKHKIWQFSNEHLVGLIHFRKVSCGLKRLLGIKKQ